MKRLVYTLLILLIIATISFLAIFNAQPTGNAIAIAGQTTQLQIQPSTPWGGIYGRLAEQAPTQTTIHAGQIKTQTIHHYNQSCQATDIIASENTVSLATIQPVSPEVADATLGFNPQNPFSISKMYTQQHIYNIQGTEHVLWTTTTTGQLGNYYQAIARAGTDIIFLTEAKNNGLAYNGESATYQFLLLEGTWQLQTDETDTCFEGRIITQNETDDSSINLQAAIPQRICVGEEHTLYAVDSPERTLCRPSDVPLGCEPLAQVESTITQDGQQIEQTTTDEIGEILFTPESAGTYNIALQYHDQRTSKQFSAQNCLDYGKNQDEPTIITREREQLSAQPLTSNPQSQEPGELTTGQAAYMLVVLLSISTLMVSAIVYARAHADDNVYVLELRILWERLKGIWK